MDSQWFALKKNSLRRCDIAFVSHDKVLICEEHNGHENYAQPFDIFLFNGRDVNFELT